MTTIRYYTNNNKYMGWEYLQRGRFLSYKSWMLSGNNLRIGKAIINDAGSLLMNASFKRAVK
jgi:hypothetical protein